MVRFHLGLQRLFVKKLPRKVLEMNSAGKMLYNLLGAAFPGEREFLPAFEDLKPRGQERYEEIAKKLIKQNSLVKTY